MNKMELLFPELDSLEFIRCDKLCVYIAQYLCLDYEMNKIYLRVTFKMS